MRAASANMRGALLAAHVCGCAAAALLSVPQNLPVMIDMVQNNPVRRGCPTRDSKPLRSFAKTVAERECGKQAVFPI